MVAVVVLVLFLNTLEMFFETSIFTSFVVAKRKMILSLNCNQQKIIINLFQMLHTYWLILYIWIIDN
jgi:hypothetical protein